MPTSTPEGVVPGAQGCPGSDARRVRQAGAVLVVRYHTVLEAQLQSGEDLGRIRVRVSVVCQ